MSRKQELSARRRFWLKHIRNWRESGLKQAEYCRHHNLVAYQLSYWFNRLKKEPQSLSFVQVSLPSTPPPAEVQTNFSPLKLFIEERYHLEVERGFDPVTLGQLLTILKRVG